MLDEEYMEGIRSELRQIKVLLVLLILIVVTLLVGLANLLKFAGGVFLIAGVIVGMCYVVLLLAERLLGLKKAGRSEKQLEEKILREFNVERKKQDAN